MTLKGTFHVQPFADFLFENASSPASLSYIFVFSNKYDNFYNNVKKIPSSIRCWDSNPWPSENESPPALLLTFFMSTFESSVLNVSERVEEWESANAWVRQYGSEYHKQCYQMVKLCFNIWPFVTIKLAQ